MSKTSIKPGVLAFVVNSKHGNDGKIVEAVKCLGVDPVWDGKRWNRGSVSWLCRTAGGPLVSFNAVSNKKTERMELPIAEKNLKPIEPLSDPESEKAIDRIKNDIAVTRGTHE